MTENNGPLLGKHYWGLLVLFLAVFLVAGDFTAFSPALPSIANTFSVEITTVHWVVNSYSLSYGVLIVTAGRLADIYGRKHIFIAGVVVFAVFSIIGGLASHIWVLLISRAFMGLGGALIWSAILGMAYNLLPTEKAGLAGGFMLASLGLATSCGPVIGGFLSEYISWRWILFINFPMALITAFLCWCRYPAEKLSRVKEGIDYSGVITLSISLFLFLLAMDLLTQNIFNIVLFSVILSISLFLILLFFWVERKNGRDALIPIELMNNRSFMTAGLSVFLVAIAFFASLVYVPLLLIKIYQYTALQAGVALLPMMVASGVFALLSGFLYEKVGKKVLICIGALGMSLGLFWLANLGGRDNYFQFVPGLLLVGIGLGIYSPTIVTAAVTVVDPTESSLAGAIIYMFRFIGGALGLGINATILATAPNLEVGIRWVFTVDAFVTLIGFVVSLLYCRISPGPVFRR
ncbi:MFS transporter [Microbulbifer sp. GL-2]|uniref:MFS transporter n=1 Tax=Microbulbifer sp. GL-2 TaxID=2591606 RepID=UPI001162A83E|nr:MFS transporter [Microbulbifer sp. GL-2]BBM04021.1 hypothetical protein GL2_40950 [Microbulbifer sp. GL-2]